MLGQILSTLPLNQIPIPPLEYFFEDLDKVEHIPFNLTWEEAKDKPFCVLHTSGSTGIPKPVFVTYGTFACNDAHQLIPKRGGKPTLVNFLKGKRYFLALPLFHAACLTFTVGYNIFAGVTCVIPPSEPLTADMMNEVYKYGKLDGALLAPSLIVDCYNNPEYYETMLSNIKFLSYVGGSLPEEVGDEVTKRIKLMTLMGSCETALHPLEINEDPADWQYLTISESLGHSFVEHKAGYHELVINRDPKREIFQGVFSTFPDKQSFNSGDLFEQHPTNPQSWVFRARTDDIIAFTTAEKLNPITMESTISTNPKIKSAVIGGQGKFQASLLIEPHVYPQSAEEEAKFIKEIWPSVLQANRSCPAHGRIMKGFVFLTKPEKPIPRAGKGTVQRHAALQLYKTEFEELYEKVQPTIKEPAANGTAHKTLVEAPVEAPVQPVKAPAVKAPAVQAPEGRAPEGPALTLQDLDAKIENALAKVLPGLLDAAVQKAFSRMLLGLSGIDPTPASIPTNGLTNGHTNGHTNGYTNGYTNGHTNGTHANKDAKLANGLGITRKDVRQMIYDELAENLEVGDISDDSNLFNAGVDSLQVQALLGVLNDYLAKTKPGTEQLNAKAVYEKPTVRDIMMMMGV